MNLELFSVIFLIAVLGLGFVKKVNMGFLAIGAALILARIGGLKDGLVIGGFNSSTFITMVGSSFFFMMAVQNGTIKNLANRLLKITGKATWTVPLALSIITFALQSFGIATFPIMMPMGIALAVSIGFDPIAMGCIVAGAANLGSLSPLSTAGIVYTGIEAETAFAGLYGSHVHFYAGLATLVLTIGFFFFFKGHKIKANSEVEIGKIEPLNAGQKLTALLIVAVVFIVIVFKVTIGLVAPLAGMVLIMTKNIDEGKVIKAMPWSTFILIGCVSMLMDVVSELGGIDLVINSLASVMTESTVAPIMTLTGGILSWFSSAQGVVMPTLIPTIETLMIEFPGVEFATVASGISVNAFLAAFSPASTGGAYIMAQYAIFTNGESEKQSDKIFMKLFAISFVCVIIGALLSAFDFFSILPV